MGCGEFQGPGKGTKIFNAQYECGGNGGNYGGFQGYGLGADPDKSDLCKQFATDFAVTPSTPNIKELGVMVMRPVMEVGSYS